MPSAAATPTPLRLQWSDTSRGRGTCCGLSSGRSEREVPAIDTDLDQRVEALAGDLVATRRDLHAHPELGFAEHRTAGLIAERLQGLGLTPRVGVGGTGVVADLEGEHDGPTLLVRAAMDALPIEERSDAPYRSQEPGAMHACGH